MRIDPLDVSLLENTERRCGRVVVVEEHASVGGLGGAVLEALSEVFPCSVWRIGIPDSFGQSAWSYRALLHAYGLDAQSLTRSIAVFVGR